MEFYAVPTFMEPLLGLIFALSTVVGLAFTVSVLLAMRGVVFGKAIAVSGVVCAALVCATVTVANGISEERSEAITDALTEFTGEVPSKRTVEDVLGVESSDGAALVRFESKSGKTVDLIVEMTNRSGEPELRLAPVTGDAEILEG